MGFPARGDGRRGRVNTALRIRETHSYQPRRIGSRTRRGSSTAFTGRPERRRWATLVQELGRHRDVRTIDWGPRGGRPFASLSLRIHGRVFALLYRDTLVVKLPGSDVGRLVRRGVGDHWNPTSRGPFREWLEVDGRYPVDWSELAEQAWAFVRSLKTPSARR